ncbi:endonuclease/exonuclease/phosphatase family protein [Desulfoluna spongiiphila]|uniref:Endonuclease/Exonuclease/phosphatase family protein n=1 Tax=Desulfoluna spongiiphila TaxID=419481 RepID=A0A1G5DMN9_9BACT|nr:endonuclease/exonuclease/phosphatase family protein [Desulfoluna spongiiphila]SCY15771.1 Endonuclease/Exonuclease/phosphatase family protein [Desulfoluna spongiiphila]
MVRKVVTTARLLAGFLVFLLGVPASAEPGFRLVSYNVENLFDLTRNGSEYADYVPNTGTGWNDAAARVKYANIASVLAGSGAHVAVLSEVESPEALARLQRALLHAGQPMSHGVVATHPTTVRCAVLSCFPISQTHEISPGPGMRSILRVTLNVTGIPLVVYANHWKSKQGPESERLPYARALTADIATLPSGTDYILAGDFNTNHNEWQRFSEEPRLNDTRGKTGINHLLGTIHNNAMVTEEKVVTGKGLHYNLWMELPPEKRWSYRFHGRKGSLDHILLPAALYDGKGISYVDGSFHRYAPEHLFRKGKIFRWQRADGGRGRHLGRGYSDHLPVCAEFRAGPFEVVRKGEPALRAPVPQAAPPEASVADLYNLPPGPANYRLRGVVVLYKAGSNAVVKSPGGRAIYLYKVGKALQPGWIVDMTVTRLADYYGLREVTAVTDMVRRGKADTGDHLLAVGDAVNLRDGSVVNEVVERVCGLYRDGWLQYGNGRSIRVYTVKGMRRPENDTHICLSRVRVGFHRDPELVLERVGQMK